MRCARCQRPLMRAYVQDGPFAWGPGCAKIAGFTKPTGPRIKAPADHVPDAGQMVLVLEPVKVAYQGHRYSLGGIPVIALDSGHDVRVGEWDEQWFSKIHRVIASELIPQPMRYFQGGLL